MPYEIKVGTWLDCGCCGMGFKTWEGYEDQDQDLDYGICFECQGDAEIRNEEEYDKLIATVRTGFKNTDTLARFDARTRDGQKAFALHCLNKGIIKYSFRSPA